MLDSASPRFAEALLQVLGKTLQTLAERRAEQDDLHARMRQFGIVGTCPPLVSAFREAARFSQFSDLPLLICGASGTGKELFSRAIAGMDPKRHAGPFVAIILTFDNSGRAGQANAGQANGKRRGHSVVAHSPVRHPPASISGSGCRLPRTNRLNADGGQCLGPGRRLAALIRLRLTARKPWAKRRARRRIDR